MNCPKCNFNNAFGNYCRKCGSPLNVKIAFPTKTNVVPDNGSNNNLTNANNEPVNNSSTQLNPSNGYQRQSTLNSVNKWFRK